MMRRWWPSGAHAAAALIVAGASFAGLAVVPGTAGAQADDAPILGLGSLTLTLVDHTIDVAADGDVTLTYEITGELADAELLFIDANAPAPAPEPDTGEPATDTPGAEPTPEPVPEPEPIPISVDVIVDDRVDETDDLIGRLGPSATTTAFASPLDGILVEDARPLIEIAEDGTVTLRLTVGTDRSPSQADRIGLDDAGLYPALVSLRVDGSVVARHGTVLHRTAARPQAAEVGIAGLAAVPQPTTILSEAELGPLVDDAARIVEFAELTPLPLTLSIPPPVVDQLVVGTSAGAIVAASLRDDTLQSLAATPFDISSAVAIGRDDAFLRQLTAGEEDLQAALPGVPVRRDVWLVDRPISADAATLMRTLGVRLLAMPASVAAATLDPVPDPLPIDRVIAVALADGSTLPALILDDADDVFGDDATERTLREMSPTEWAIEYLARLRLSIEEDEAVGVNPLDGRARLLAASDLGPLDPRLLDELVRLDARTEIHRIADASTFASTVAAADIEPAPTLPAIAGPSLDDRLEVIEQTGLVVINAASMLPEDDERPSRWTSLLDALVSTAYTDDQVQAAVDAVTAETDRLTSSVVASEPFSLTLTSREETIPLEIENRADEPLRVRIELSSQRLQFPDGDPEVTLAAGSVTEVEIPVVARTNGTTSLEYRIVTPLGGELTEPVRVSARVQALSGLAQLITAVLVILLLTWWFNHWRTRRRENGNDDSDPPDPMSETDQAGSDQPDSDQPGGDQRGPDGVPPVTPDR